MGERLDYLMGLTMFSIQCPECGEHGKGRWVDRDRDVVMCTRCGARFRAREHTWRPVTGGMTDEELSAHLDRQRAERNRRFRERYRNDSEFRRLRLEKNRKANHRYWKRKCRKRRDRALIIWKETKMGKRDTLGDLTDHLFAELERLGDEELSLEELEAEIERSKAITSVAQTVINNANVVLKAAIFQDNRMDAGKRLPRMLTEGGD